MNCSIFRLKCAAIATAIQKECAISVAIYIDKIDNFLRDYFYSREMCSRVALHVTTIRVYIPSLLPSSY